MKRAKGGAGISFNKTHWALALAAFGAAAQAAPVGPEFRVNTHTTNRQMSAAVAMDADGDFVVVWESYKQDDSYSGGEDFTNWGIYAQRYDKTGAPQGGEFLVNTVTTGSQRNPKVAMDAEGDFIVVWNGLGPLSPIDYSYDIYARRYNAAGVAQDATEFRVNTEVVVVTDGAQGYPSVAMDQDGDFVVAWARANQEEQPGYEYPVTTSIEFIAQRFNASGAAQGGEILVKELEDLELLSMPTVAMDQANNFVVVWGESSVVQAQRYNSAGTPQGSEFQVNTITTVPQGAPSVAMDQDGDFVVAWETLNGVTPDDNDVYARRFNAAGVGQGLQFLVHSFTTDSQSRPAVAMEQDGEFVVAWTSGVSEEVSARRFSAGGVPDGSEFPVNTHTTGSQRNSSVALDQEGDCVVAWASDRFVPDGSSEDIYAQRFGPGVAGPVLVNSRFAAPTLSGKSTSNTPMPEGPAGVYQFTSKFCVNAGAGLTDLFSRTKQLTNNNSLISRTRDAAAPPPGGAGSEQDFPLTGAYADELLTTGECADVVYRIGLANKASFTFRIDLYGNEAP